jgi:hypothetical protein
MKYGKWASALGALAVILFAVGCGTQGAAPATKSRSGGGLELGVNMAGLQATLGQNVCVRWDAAFKAPNGTTYGKNISSNDWVCGQDGQDQIAAGFSSCYYTGAGDPYLYFIEYEIAFCAPNQDPGDQGPCGQGDGVVFRSRAAAKGHCGANFSNVYAWASVQFDNKLPNGGGLHPMLDVDQVCWNLMLDPPGSCLCAPVEGQCPANLGCGIDPATQECVHLDRSQCVTFGLHMGPSTCTGKTPDAYCSLGQVGRGAGGAPDFNPAYIFTYGQDPVVDFVSAQGPVGGGWGWDAFFLSFPPGLLTGSTINPGFTLINAPWLLQFTADPAGNVAVHSYNRDTYYTTVGSWLFSNGSTSTLGFVTANPPDANLGNPPPVGGLNGTPTTYLYWDGHPDCNAGVHNDGNEIQWGNTIVYNDVTQCGPNEKNKTIMKGVTKLHGNVFAIVYACVAPSQIDLETGEFTGTPVSLWKIECDASNQTDPCHCGGPWANRTWGLTCNSPVWQPL